MFNQSETVSEADLAEADQSRHTVVAGEDETGDTAEGIELLVSFMYRGLKFYRRS